MAMKTKVIHGWAYKEEDVSHLIDVAMSCRAGDVLFSKQSDATTGIQLKRMTLRITIEDYVPKRKKT